MTPLLVALALAGAPRVAVVVHTTGFTDGDAQRITDKAREETTALGVELWALAGALQIKLDCLGDRACAREVARTADVAYLVSLQVLRAGGQAAVDASLIDADGRVLAEHQSVRKLDVVLSDGAVLPPEVTTTLREAVSSASAAPAAAVPAAPSAPPSTPPTTTASSPTAPPPDAPAELAPLALGGVATLGVGALAALAGGAVVAAQFGVLNDPRSLRDEKEQAALVWIPAMGAVALGGVAVASAGAAMLWLGLDEG